MAATGNLKAFRAKALKQGDVKQAYDALHEEFVYLDELLKARMKAGLTQQEMAQRMGTSQSVVARLESGYGQHSPSLATLQRYAQAAGKRLVIRFA
jgi:DNA-binding XRE family transcriptional regulator